jgi:hypothetical protein
MLQKCPKCGEVAMDENARHCVCGYSFEGDMVERVVRWTSKWRKFFHYHRLNAKYSALYLIALFVDILAIIAIISSLVSVVVFFPKASVIEIVNTLLVGIVGFIVLKALAETIILFIGLEENTSRTNELLTEIRDQGIKT